MKKRKRSFTDPPLRQLSLGFMGARRLDKAAELYTGEDDIHFLLSSRYCTSFFFSPALSDFDGQMPRALVGRSDQVHIIVAVVELRCRVEAAGAHTRQHDLRKKN